MGCLLQKEVVARFLVLLLAKCLLVLGMPLYQAVLCGGDGRLAEDLVLLRQLVKRRPVVRLQGRQALFLRKVGLLALLLPLSALEVLSAHLVPQILILGAHLRFLCNHPLLEKLQVSVFC